jgi:hypothetical protein
MGRGAKLKAQIGDGPGSASVVAASDVIRLLVLHRSIRVTTQRYEFVFQAQVLCGLHLSSVMRPSSADRAVK